MRGRFITFEGGEGAGKTTQARRLAAWLAERGGEVVVTREPGGTAGAEQIRRLVVEGPPERWDRLTELLLMMAARQEHVVRLIRPALARGKTVICDRFHDSSRAYQGHAGGLGVAVVDRLHEPLLQDLKPDLTLLLDLPVNEGLARRQATGEHGRFERMDRDFHERLREGFLGLAAAEPDRFVVIDASQPANAVAANVQEATVRLLGASA